MLENRASCCRLGDKMRANMRIIADAVSMKVALISVFICTVNKRAKVGTFCNSTFAMLVMSELTPKHADL